MQCNSVTLTGVQLRGISRNSDFKSLNAGAVLRTGGGFTTARLSDFAGVKLEPSLQPGNFVQTFIEGPVIQRANELWADIPQIAARERLQPMDEIDFDALSFALQHTDAMFCVTIKRGDEWPDAYLVPREKFLIDPAAGVMNYAQGIFEGMKAYRTSEGNIVLFRPFDNAIRAREGARRLAFTPIPEKYFVSAVEKTVKANERWIPPMGKGSLYIRPLLVGTGGILGVAPAPEETFFVYVSPVGPYFKGGLKTIDLLVSDEYHRVPSGACGSVKYIGNYANGMVPAMEAKQKGYSEVMYLDAQNHTFIEEIGAANAFFVKGQDLYTPKLGGTILPGITRRSVLVIAQEMGLRVWETPVTIDFVMNEADEVFCTGTAAVISPVGSITHGCNEKVYNNREVGSVTRALYEALTGIQEQRLPDKHGWVHVIK
ncbi:MAG: branched-chain amino acid aminotransferase [Candidatus Margulisbacteria bacterium]|nr:branched-chain amino acid aminotransferase [Candidatus Margulisiibacteriota bacterium]